MAEELPPAVARFIADVTQYTEPLQRAIEDTKKFGDRTDVAALKARQMALAAREGADKAAAAMKIAEEAAARFERGEISLAEATRAATNAAQAQARADLQLAAAQNAVNNALKNQENQQKKTSKEVQKSSFMEAGMLSKIWTIAGFATGSLEPLAAGILAITGGLSSGLVSAVMGLGAFGILAKSVFTASAASATNAKAAQDAYTASIAKAQQTYATTMKTATTATARHNALLREQTAIQAASKAQTVGLNQAYHGMSQSEIQLGKNIMHLKTMWQGFITAVSPGIATVADGALALVPRFLQYISMFLPSVETGLAKVIQLISKGTNTSWFISFMQAMSANSGDSIEKIAVAIGHLFKGIAGLMVAFAPFSQVVLKGLDQMTGKFAAWGQGLNQTKGFGEFMTMVKTQGPTIVGILKNLATIATMFIKDMAGSASNMLWMKIVPQITALAAAFMKANPGLVEWAMNIMLVTSTMKSGVGAITSFTTGIGNFAGGVGKAYTGTSNLVKGFNSAEFAATEASGAMGTFGGKLKTVLGGASFTNFAKGFKSADQAASEATGTMGTLGGKVSAVFNAITAATLAPVKGLGNFAKGFKNAEAAASDATGVMGTFGGSVSKGFGAIGSAAKSGGAAIASAFSNAFTAVMMLPSLLSGAVTAIREWAIWSKIAAAATKVWTVIQAAFDIVMAANPLVLIIVGIMAAVGVIIYCYTHFKIFRDVVHNVFEFIKQHWPLILAILTGPIGLAVYFIIKYWNTIYGFFKKIIVDIINFVKSHWPLILGILGGPIGLAVFLIMKYWKQIYHVFLTGVDWVLNSLHSLLSKTLAMFKGVGSLLVNAGKWLVMGFVHGIESMFGYVVNAAYNLIKSLGNTVLKVLGIGSPSKTAMWWGQMTGHGLALGMLGQVGNVKQAAMRMTSAVNAGMAAGTFRPGAVLATSPRAVAGTSAASGNVNVYVDGKKLFEVMKSQIYQYNIRNSGAVTGVVRPV